VAQLPLSLVPPPFKGETLSLFSHLLLVEQVLGYLNGHRPFLFFPKMMKGEFTNPMKSHLHLDDQESPSHPAHGPREVTFQSCLERFLLCLEFFFLLKAIYAYSSFLLSNHLILLSFCRCGCQSSSQISVELNIGLTCTWERGKKESKFGCRVRLSNLVFERRLFL
jgi:hypothetical protein